VVCEKLTSHVEPLQYPPGGTSGVKEPIEARKMNPTNLWIKATRTIGPYEDIGEWLDSLIADPCLLSVGVTISISTSRPSTC